MEENWKYIEEFKERYLISDKGRVISLIKRGRILKQAHDRSYYYVSLMKNAKVKNMRIHRLVAKAFILNPENKAQVNHKDGNKLNNNVSNLEWVTDAENRQHAAENGLMCSGERQHAAKLTMDKAREIRLKKSEGYRVADLSREYNVDPKTINEVVKNTTWKERI